MILHVSMLEQHRRCVDIWLKAKSKERLCCGGCDSMRGVAGRVMQWHARAIERAYARGGPGFDEARASFQAHARV